MPDAKFLFDENIGKIPSEHFASQGFDAVSVVDEMQGAEDKEVLAYARRTKRMVVTLDKDFAGLVFRDSLPHTGVILLRLDDESPKNIIGVFGPFSEKIGNIPNLHKRFIVLSEEKIRIR